VTYRKGSGCSIAALCVLALGAVYARAQQSSPAREPATGQQPSPQAPLEERPISWKQFPSNFAQDQKRLWLFPKSLAQGKHWEPAAAFILGTGALVALDPHDAPYFRRTQTFSGFNRIASSRNTAASMAIVPAAFYAFGLARHDEYMQKTVQLAGEAVLDGEVLNVVMRDVSRRLPPRDIPLNGDFSDTWFRRQKGLFYVGSGGFPSGHMIAAVSLATVFARRYSNRRWVPWLAYGLAGIVGFSRVTASDHFFSDVFAGTVLGYAITRYDVLSRP
jgi:membrane-associated phospholipid phosphatase